MVAVLTSAYEAHCYAAIRRYSTIVGLAYTYKLEYFSAKSKAVYPKAVTANGFADS